MEKRRGTENEEVALLVRIGSSELPLSIGKFQVPFDFLSSLRTVCFSCSAGGGRKDRGWYREEAWRTVKRVWLGYKISKSPSREPIERRLTEGLFY